ncbi:Glycosyl transferase family 2 [Prochlorococcus marinus str. MIT 1313]|uniref:glycosyltransferase family 2 protein n=1 Tax=Prochlorococcus TaxID=1218 RepID=UPI0007B32575|nr:glycosyltransferase [Prochlorococcus marinus]KZR72356.1 Glycosyl transferase family 2 [Prochlorococcus marinus str. MIT 1313]KZR74051.1 Glycosyl transferase family 2 [Prochlorococcus marinus str. MIT 1318]
MSNLDKILTIWIPTFRRPQQLQQLLDNVIQTKIVDLAKIVISDNDPEGPLAKALMTGEANLPDNISYRCNSANLSAGVNFLRAFECCTTTWLMIVGDDDLFNFGAADRIQEMIASLGGDIAAVKFDSSLFGFQPACVSSGLCDYVDQLSPRDYPDAFNNLCLISNWLFRSESYRPYLASAYLGYSSKISHLFPALQACVQDDAKLMFSKLQPVEHGISDASWPKAATWFEMVITLASFSGFIDAQNRSALLKLLLHSDWQRNIAKCLRVQHFYGDQRLGLNCWRMHMHLALISISYLQALLLSLPLLLLPYRLWPRSLRNKLGDPGSIERW